MVDPWNDAYAISTRLQRDGAELLIVVGAEAWCQKCQRLRPAFELLCEDSMPDQVTWMWLDLEDHADLLGGFIPPDLPLLLRWRQGVCVQAAVVVDIALDFPLAERVKLQPLPIEGARVQDAIQDEWVELPELWDTFSTASWASDA